MRTTTFTRALVAGALAATGLALVSATPAHAATITVCESGCDFDTVSGAVAAAADGDTIEVAAGTYVEPESIQITKGLTIVGAGSGQTIIDGQGDASALAGQLDIRTLAGQDVTVQGLTVRNPVIRGSLRVAIAAKSIVEPAPSYLFDDVEIIGADDGNEYGVWTENSTAPLTFRNGSISNTNANPILVEEPRATTVFEGNTIELNGSGYFSMKTNPNQFDPPLHSTAPQIIEGNTFTGTAGTPIAFVAEPTFVGPDTGGYLDIQVRDNVITGGTAMGISVANDATDEGAGSANANVVVEGNTITGNGGGTAGVRVRGLVEDVTITGNDISGFTNGVLATPNGAHEPAGITANLNRIVGNGTGVRNDTTSGIDATHNWWGCNAGPGGEGCDTVAGDVTADPWLVLDIAGPTTVSHPDTADYTVSIDQDSAGDPVDVSAFPGGDITFAASAGSITSPEPLDPTEATGTFTPPALNGPVTISGTLDHQTVSIDLDVDGAPLARTRLVADAFVLDTVPQLALRLGVARATLTNADTGTPLAGQEVVFRTAGGELCRDTTNAQGVATCSGDLAGLLGGVLGLGYTGHYAGDLNHQATAAAGKGRGPLIRIGGLRLL